MPKGKFKRAPGLSPIFIYAFLPASELFEKGARGERRRSLYELQSVARDEAAIAAALGNSHIELADRLIDASADLARRARTVEQLERRPQMLKRPRKQKLCVGGAAHLTKMFLPD